MTFCLNNKCMWMMKIKSIRCINMDICWLFDDVAEPRAALLLGIPLETEWETPV